jgi:cofilin
MYRFIVYALNPPLTEIQVYTTAPPSATYDDFVEFMKEAEEKKECRYGVYDAEFELRDGQKRSKLVFFLWSPEGAKIKQKMVYTSSKDYLKRSLVGIGKEVQACDHGDLAWTNVLEVCLRSESAN